MKLKVRILVKDKNSCFAFVEQLKLMLNQANESILKNEGINEVDVTKLVELSVSDATLNFTEVVVNETFSDRTALDSAKQKLIKEFVDVIKVYFDHELRYYYIEVNFKIKAMQPIVYKAPFNKKYAISINGLTIDNPIKIKERQNLNYSVYFPNKIPKEFDIKLDVNAYNYFKKLVLKSNSN